MIDVQRHLDFLDEQARLTRETKGESLTVEDAQGIAKMWRESLPEAEREATTDAVMAAMAARKNGAKR